MSTTKLYLRIGVDVGGTNTDAVLLDPIAISSHNRGILSWHKSPTTANPSEGIENVVKALLQNAEVDAQSIASVTIGTTHFINAVVEKDQSRLAPVAVLRLCGPFSRSVPPGVDWPSDLRSIICAYCGFLDGGLEIDGQIIRHINEEQVKEECEKIKVVGIRSIVVNGIFAPADVMGERQEERVGEWVKKYYPEAEVVLSKKVANLGFIERENAAILNASILAFARRTISQFQKAIHHRLALSCPVFLTQNDGTILQAEDAARLPIRTFNSGPTNSMCGAAFLVKGAGPAEASSKKENMLVVDIGGTTTDVGMLLPSGLPRQAAAVTEIASVRMNFSCPDVKSIGLGGGSIVRLHDSQPRLSIGPDSVGHRITERALVFGGDIHTTTDYAVVSQSLTRSDSSSQSIGNKQLALDELKKITTDVLDLLNEHEVTVRKMLEGIIDKMKTSADDVSVLLVGGGAVIVSPDQDDKVVLNGVSRVIRPEYSGVANAIGAAIARVSGIVDVVLNTEGRTTASVLEEVSKIAIGRAVENGAVRETIEIAEMDAIPIQYVANKCRVIVKAIGDFDFTRVPSVTEQEESFQVDAATSDYTKNPLKDKEKTETPSVHSAGFISSYKPAIIANERGHEWVLSELDLEWISCGCYILGTGGGGTPYPHFVRLREMMRNGAKVRVVEPAWLTDTDVVACGGAKGSPTVSMEKLPGDEMIESQNMVYNYLGYKPVAVIDLEIGGGNGLQGLILGASTNMNIPTIDGDWMGRAYPVAWQITPVVWGGDKAQFVPTAISDGNGNNMLMLSGTTEKIIERAFRAALAEMGSYVACAKGPTTGAKVKAWAVENTISLSWRIGRAVALCRAENNVDYVADAIINQVGGPEASKVLFKGKIVGVERKTVKGHVYGEVIIGAADVSGSGSGSEENFKGQLKIPFKNENILAVRVDEDGKEEIVASVPDLICVCDASSGEAIGTPEYRYGLLVFVLGIQGSEKWTSIPRGLEIGGPRAFGMDVDYKPLGTFKKPRSVIEEFSS
ncbi:hydantoinase [Moniliophthora roreri MCA 2997]|uniref:Hydantoinase n=1 Tax=Moniliophthora roreri (strain MCA 2997) TaxID=1381753 RepID=V2XTJ1_MONRO|nr:hydantoinase [Moniliophthora roreri MCA 2997]